MISEQQLMEILKKYFETKGFVTHQLSSFNHMIQHSLQEIVGEESVIEVSPKQGVEYRVEFGQVHVDKPYVTEEDRTVRKIYPAEAKLRNHTYSAPISLPKVGTNTLGNSRMARDTDKASIPFPVEKNWLVNGRMTSSMGKV